MPRLERVRVSAAWQPVEDALNRARDTGRTLRFWLRDDDAIAVTEPLGRLRDLCAAAGMPVLLAVIPASAQDPLGPWIDANPSFTPCQHGYSHVNHAAADARACELASRRPQASVLDELTRGRCRLLALFGPRLADILVPPWNRIDPALIPHLPALGFAALSTFGRPPATTGGIGWLNCDLDIIDWRNGRIGRSFYDLCTKLVPLVGQSRETGTPIGILTHHLAHDAQAWAALTQLLERLEAHPATEFAAAATLRHD